MELFLCGRVIGMEVRAFTNFKVVMCYICIAINVRCNILELMWIIIPLFYSLKEQTNLYKEEGGCGNGSCTSLQWMIDPIEAGNFLFVGFGNGRLISYLLSDGVVRLISKVLVSSPVSFFVLNSLIERLKLLVNTVYLLNFYNSDSMYICLLSEIIRWLY